MADKEPLGLRAKEWETYRRLLDRARPYMGRLALGILFGLIFGSSTTALIYSLKQTLAKVFSPDEFALMTTLGIAALLPVFGLVRGLGDYVGTYLIEWVGNRVVMDLRVACFAHLQDLSVGYYSSSKTGELISRTTNDTSMVERAVSTVLSDLAKQPFTLLGLIGFLCWLDWRLALISLVVFPVCILPVALFGRRVRKAARGGQEKMGDMVSILQETISGVRIVKAFGMEAYETNRFYEQCRAVFRRAMQVTRARASIEPLLILISLIGFALILLYARWTRMKFDDFFTFGVALIAMYEPVKRLSKVHMNIQQSSAAADRIFELLDTPVRVSDRPGAATFDEPVREVTFDNVSFAYETAPVLQEINFGTQRGQCFALVGSSGSGKTTLVGLVPRFYDVTAGRILINGRDIRDLTQISLRRQIGIVTQETFLFNDTVANNISYGQQNTTPEAVREAARRANAHEFIEALPEGYNTMVGERGVRLSGGQRQRLAIARALLRNPPILILDEATSALDTESERLVQGALDTLIAGRTVFAIAHRLSTIQHADVILVLDQGRIVERGTHQELLARSGIYRRLHDLQFQDSAPSAVQA